jgi:hypothetical protein
LVLENNVSCRCPDWLEECSLRLVLTRRCCWCTM